MRDEAGGMMVSTNQNQLAHQGETAASALAAQAEATVKARYWIAVSRPRDQDTVRTLLLKECQRTSFAEAAIYAKPIGGKKVTGPSVRFAEAAARMHGNIFVTAPVVYDDETKRIIEVTAMDLENNHTESKQVVVTKQVERRFIPDGESSMGTRRNANGDLLYIIRASDDALLNKENALVSKAKRNCILAVIDGALVDECMEAAAETKKKQNDQDPDAAKKRIVDAFAAHNILPRDLKEYLAHDLDKVTSEELEDLRNVFEGIRDGEAHWNEVIKQRRAERGEGTADVGDTDGSPRTLNEAAATGKKKTAEAPRSVSQPATPSEQPAPSAADKAVAAPPNPTPGAGKSVGGEKKAMATGAPKTDADGFILCPSCNGFEGGCDVCAGKGKIKPDTGKLKA